MKPQTKLLISFIAVFLTVSGYSQDQQKSKWIVDGNSFFTSQRILYSERSDTVIFLTVSFVSDYLKVNDVEKITYNKKTKKLIIINKDEGSLVMNGSKNGMKLVSELDLSDPDGWKKVNFIEYTIGEHSVYAK
jgi:hypothetical protein